MVTMLDASTRVALDARQRAAVDHDAGPLLVLGGPGTGKSTVLVERWVRLATSVVAPHRALLLVGQRERALALRDELAWRLPQQAIIEIPAHTWHALAYHLVTRYYRRLGFREPPVLLSPAEQWGVVRELLEDESRGAWGAYGPALTSHAFVDEVADFCLRANARLVSDDELDAIAASDPANAQAARFCRRYRAHMRVSARLDGEALIAVASEVLDDPDTRAAVRRRFVHVLVDDADELSPAQAALLERLERAHLVCAAVSTPAWMDDPATVRLDTSHRFGSSIAGAAGRLGAHVTGGAAHDSAGVRVAPTLAAEIDAAARDVRAAHLGGVPYRRIAVILAQPGAYLTPLRRALESLGVPSRIAGSDRPSSAEPAVRAVLDLCRCALDPDCPDDVLWGVLASPLVGCEAHVVRELRRDAFRRSEPFKAVVASSDECAQYRALVAVVAEHPDEPADATFARLFETAEWTRSLARRRDADDEAASAVAALIDFARSLARFVERRPGGTMRDFLASSARADLWAEPARAASRGADTVSLLSLPAARSGEWDVVCILGVNEGQLPATQRAHGLFDPWTSGGSTGAESARARLDDERRMLLKALTRATTSVVASTSPGPSGRATPSRFLEEAFGELPEPSAAETGGPPLTVREVENGLRRAFASPDTAEKAAAACALARVPGVDPRAWWWRWDWTPSERLLAPAGKLTTSYSRIGVYENCPLQYVLRSVLGLEHETTYQMKFGSLVHKIIELVEKGEITDWEQVVRTYQKGFDPDDYPNRVFARTYYRSGVRMLKLWWRSERNNGETIETEYAFDSLDLDGHTIRGRIDRIAKVDRGLRLVDYKTSRSMLAWDKARRSLQLAIYYLAATRDEKLREHGDPYRMLLVYPAYEDFDEPGTPAKRYQTPEDAEETLEGLRGYLARAAAEEFAPSPDADCQWCKMRPLCPRWPEGREVVP